MFDSLSDKISGVFRKLGGNIRLTESNIQEGLREIRLALLEADVSLPVVKDFIARVTERALGQEVLRDVTPGQYLVKVVNEELVELLGGQTQELNLTGSEPHVIMLVGLQGSGKTTSAAKLAHLLRERKMRPYLVPADVYRPAAIDQLTTLAGQLDMPVYPSQTGMNPVDIAEAGGVAYTKSITVRSTSGERFDRIVDYELDEKPEPLPLYQSLGFSEDEIPF